MTIDWGGTDLAMLRRMAAYEQAVFDALHQLALYFAALLETYAKENRPWKDRTSNARQSLAGYVDDQTPVEFNAPESAPYLPSAPSKRAITITLSHGMKYGVQLEREYDGRFAIIWPSIEAHLDMFKRALEGLLK